MRITDIQITKRDTYTELSAMMNDFRLWYRVPADYEVSPSGDMFLAAGLFPAMANGEDLEIKSQVCISPKLVKGMMLLQQIYHCWNPALKKIEIHGEMSVSEPKNLGVSSFFSGGIDGAYTLLKHKEEITHLIYINGFDFVMDEEDFAKAVLRRRRITDLFDKCLIPIKTNFNSYMARNRIHSLLRTGSCLASVAHILGFSMAYIPSGTTYNALAPEGTHPLTDPLWSNEATEVIHDGADTMRTEKTQLLTENAVIRDNLIVCWEKPDQNCGKCPKCIRTMITLKILGVKSSAFPKDLRIRDVKQLRIGSNVYHFFYQNILDLAKQKNDRKMVKALKIALRRNTILFLIKDLDTRYLRGAVVKFIRFIKHRHAPDKPYRIKPSPK
ncbi:hypothetical protein AC481_00775 [miscellaneous Crenarchaeota group archaeon SMTZ-80]|nr:MAG: hypothetical protein AC481_00775 [miscellaneous Crenarchaeota group archaeon SMTZ-80]